jgi:hypothetical protein
MKIEEIDRDLLLEFGGWFDADLIDLNNVSEINSLAACVASNVSHLPQASSVSRRLEL